MIFKKTEKNIFARSCQNKFEKNANSSYLNVWTSVRFLKAIYSKGWWKIVGETLNNNALSSQWINQYTLFFKMPLTTKWLPLSLSGGDSLCYIDVTQFSILFSGAHARARLDHHNSAEVCFASFFSNGFITTIVVNPPERKLAKRTSVHCEIPLTARDIHIECSKQFNWNLYFDLSGQSGPFWAVLKLL